MQCTVLEHISPEKQKKRAIQHIRQLLAKKWATKLEKETQLMGVYFSSKEKEIVFQRNVSKT